MCSMNIKSLNWEAKGCVIVYYHFACPMTTEGYRRHFPVLFDSVNSEPKFDGKTHTKNC